MTTHDATAFHLPTIAVCAPQDLSNALNYDLARLTSGPKYFSMAERPILDNINYEIFVGNLSKAFSERMIRIIEDGNIEGIFEGYDGFPEITKAGYKINMFSPNGSFQSPGFNLTKGNKKQEMFKGEEFLYIVHTTDIVRLFDPNFNITIQFMVEVSERTNVEYSFNQRTYHNLKTVNNFELQNGRLNHAYTAEGKRLVAFYFKFKMDSGVKMKESLGS